MSCEIDEQSADYLRALRGHVIHRIAGSRYPSVSAYSEVRLFTESLGTIVVSLRMEEVDNNLEVCVPVVRLRSGIDTETGTDRLTIAAFRVAQVFRLQRRESVEWSSVDPDDYVGSTPREQRLAEVSQGYAPGTYVLDAGIALVSSDGISLELYADSFPLVLQLRLSVAGSAVPTPLKVPLT
jgi:hypothetical protein